MWPEYLFLLKKNPFDLFGFLTPKFNVQKVKSYTLPIEVPDTFNGLIIKTAHTVDSSPQLSSIQQLYTMHVIDFYFCH